MKKYYEAYDHRYKRVHEQGLLWFKSEPTPELINWLEYYEVPLDENVLEVGCGEGRDAIYMAERGYQITATDISEEAIKTCAKMCDAKQVHVNLKVEDFVCKDAVVFDQYDWIYSIGTLHMLVEDEDRKRFLRNLHGSISPSGKLLLVSKGDGVTSIKTDKSEAFKLVERVHYLDKQEMKLEATSFCMKSWENHVEELEACGFKIEKQFISKDDIYDDCMVVYLGKR